MPRNVVRDTQAGFAGGLNLTADPTQLQPGQVRSMENGRLTSYGGIQKRRGTRRISPSAVSAGVAVQNGFTWFRLTRTEVLAVLAGTLYTASFIPFVSSESLLTESLDMLTDEDGAFLVTEASYSSFASQAGSLSASETPDFAAFRSGSGECVYIADGGRLNRWDGTTLVTDIASTPECVSITVYNQRLVGVTGQNQSVFYSALNDGDTLGIGASGGGEAIIRTFSDQRTTAVATDGDTLYIFHEDGISRFTGYTQDDINISAAAAGVTGQVGTRSPFSVVQTVRGIFFLGNDGFYVLRAGSLPQKISTPIDAMLRGLNGNQIAGVRGVHDTATASVRWMIPALGVYAFNYELNAWLGPDTAGYLSPRTSSLWESQNESGQYTVLRGDADGWVTLCDAPGIYLDDADQDGTGGSSFSLSVTCKRMYSGDPAGEKSLRNAYLVGDNKGSSGLTVSWSNDGVSRSHAYTGTSQTLMPIPVSGRGSYFDVTITDSVEGESLYSLLDVEAFGMGRR